MFLLVSILFSCVFLIFLRFSFGFSQGKDFQKYPPNSLISPQNPSLADFLCVDPRNTKYYGTPSKSYVRITLGSNLKRIHSFFVSSI